MSNKQNTLLIVVGPTASGKTRVALEIAKHFNTEIISADSRQIFKEIPIGTAAPNRDELSTVKHHFVGTLSILDNYNVSLFENDVLNLLEQKFKQHKLMVMAGGSGLYVDAVCNGIDDLPDPDEAIRKSLNKTLTEKGIQPLREQLKVLDPVYYNQIDLQNPKRLMRAIEVCLQTGKPYSQLRKNSPVRRPFNLVKIGLDMPRATLYERINHRTDKMIQEGWIEEAKSVFRYRNNNALNTVGYKELFKYFDGTWPLEKAVEKIKTNTRRYAKRQITWFKRDKSIRWFAPDDIQDILHFIEKSIY